MVIIILVVRDISPANQIFNIKYSDERYQNKNMFLNEELKYPWHDER